MNWIKVKDRVPDYGEEVLIVTKKRNILVGCRESTDKNGEHFKQDGIGGIAIMEVTHWQPMLELPEEKDSKGE